jgi:hypothetical protein
MEQAEQQQSLDPQALDKQALDKQAQQLRGRVTSMEPEPEP